MNHPIDQIESFVAGGLSADESDAFKAHLTVCPACSTALEEALDADAALNDLFASTQPTAGFEDRLIESLRKGQLWRSQPIVHRMIRRAAVGIAASVLVGVAGWVGHLADHPNRLHNPAIKPIAHAEKNRPSPVDLKAGQDRYERGVEEYRAGRWADARDDFEAAIANGYTRAPGIFGDSAATYLARMQARESARSVVAVPAPIPTPPLGNDPAADAALHATARAEDLARQQANRQADDLVKQAREAQLSGNLPEAQDLFAQAVHLNPLNAAAQAGLDEILTLEARNPKTAPALSNMQETIRLRNQEITYRLETSVTEARQAIVDHKYAEASAAIQRAELAAGADRTIFPRESLQHFDEEISATQRMLDQDRVAQKLTADRLQSVDASERIDEQRKRASLERDNTIKDLRKTAIDLTKQGRYREAMGVVDQIHQLNPNDDYALGVKPVLEDRWRFQIENPGQYAVRNRLYTNQLNRADGTVAPYDDILRYPADWPDLSKGPNTAGFPYDNLDGYLLPGDGRTVENWSLATSSPPVGSGLRGMRFPSAGVNMANGAAYPANSSSVVGGVPPQGIASGGGEPGVAANTGLYASTYGPASSVPGSIGKTATALGSAPSKTGSWATEDGGYVYWGEKEGPSPANAPHLPSLSAPPPPAIVPQQPVAFDAGPVQAPPPKPQPQPKPVPAPVPAAEVVVKPKIIRTGDMDFEVDSFDSSAVTITKIVTEEGGYVSTTNSEKLPNGKVKGSIVIRVAPEHLDTLVLKLRAIGDLRTQHIVAQDITKQYTDLESKLRAAQVMQERLLDMIKNGKGTVKDLLEAEKQLGVVGENVEQLEGEIRYYNHQVSLSTLTLTLFERDIRTPAVASETDAVTMAIETENVIEADAKAKDAIAQGKGRIVNASLTQDASGKLMATIAARFPSDSADSVIGRLKQIDGRMARFDRQRNQTTSNGSSAADASGAEPIKLKREDVTLNLTIYNLANLDPRRVTIATVVVPNVEEADRLLKEQVRLAGGHILESQNSNAQPDQTSERVRLDVPTDKAEALLTSLRGMGEMLAANTTENAGAQNVTESKRGLIVMLGTLASFAPRETQQIELASPHVRDAFAELKNTLHLVSARILTDNLNEQDRTNIVGRLEFDITRASLAAFEQALEKQGQVVTRIANRAAHGENTVDSKVQISLTIGNSEQLPARETTDLAIEVANAQQAMDDLQAAAISIGGRQVDTPASTQNDNGQTTATLKLDIPLDQLTALIVKADAMGSRKSRQTSIDARAPEGKLARARLSVIFTTPAAPAVSDDGIWATSTRVLRPGFRWVGIGSILLFAGLCVAAAWVVVVWGGWRAAKWIGRASRKGAAKGDVR